MNRATISLVAASIIGLSPVLPTLASGQQKETAAVSPIAHIGDAPAAGGNSLRLRIVAYAPAERRWHAMMMIRY